MAHEFFHTNAETGLFRGENSPKGLARINNQHSELKGPEFFISATQGLHLNMDKI